MSIIPNKWHPSWDEFLTEEIIELLKNIEAKIGDNYVPAEYNVLKFLQRDLSQIKCVWLGQDPYYTMYDEDKYVANGSSFWPDDLKSWNQPFSQKSLQNIIRLIHKNYTNIEEYKNIKKYNEIKEEINAGVFKILPPDKWFQSLETQGVLLLNTYLTTEKGKGNAHRKHWKEFSIKLIKYISEKNENLIWFLWGNEAQSNKEYITGITYESNHPTFCSEKYENDFLKSNCFKNTMNIIDWRGISS